MINETLKETTNDSRAVPHDSTAVEAGTAADSIATRRMQRILDYQHESLSDPDVLCANLGILNGDLMLFACRCSQALNDALPTDQNSLADLEELTPAIDNYLRIAKQVDRFSQLLIKRKKSDDATASMPLATEVVP